MSNRCELEPQIAAIRQVHEQRPSKAVKGCVANDEVNKIKLLPPTKVTGHGYTKVIKGGGVGGSIATQDHGPLTGQRYRDRALPAVAQRGLQGFLRRYGHRAVAEIDLGMPRWSDDPSHVLGVISNYLRLHDGDLDPTSQFRAGEAKAESMISNLARRAAERSRLRAAGRLDTAEGTPACWLAGVTEVSADCWASQ